MATQGAEPHLASCLGDVLQKKMADLTEVDAGLCCTAGGFFVRLGWIHKVSPDPREEPSDWPPVRGFDGSD